MMKLAFVALAVFCLVAQISCRPPDDEKVADTVYLTKQKNLYQLFFHVDQPTVYFGELYEIARNFDLEKNIHNYDDREAVLELIKYQKNGLFYPRGEVFSVMDPEVSRQAVVLYRVLISAKDYESFYVTAVFARFFMNEGMFTYAFSVAMIHRPDTKFVKIPPLYEVLPHLFFNEDATNSAYHIAMGDTANVIKPPSDIDTYIVPTNYSGRYVPRENVQEQAVNYFIEDVGLNAFYFAMNHHFPAFMSTSYRTKNLQPQIRGEFYFFMHKQLMTRYYLERLSNGLGDILPVSLDKPISIGYHPTMHYSNGLRLPDRDTHNVVPVELEKYTQKIKDLHSRIATAIDTGFAIDSKGKQVNIYIDNGLNVLGNIVQGNADTINRRTYGSLDLLSRRVFGFSMKSDDQYHLIPSALELFCTSLRDPIFFGMYKNILGYYHRYKVNLPPYKPEELSFAGVRIDSVTVDKLITYFDKFDSMLNNGVSIRSQVEADSSITKARQQRLNHKPFTYYIKLRSDRITKAVIRIFLGPKYDKFGNEYDLKDNYMNFVEMDHFITDVKVGTNDIERHSYHSIYTVPDETPSRVLYKKVIESLDNGPVFKYHTHPYGFPDRLVLPRGTPEGMEYKLFFVVSPVDEANTVVVDSPVFGTVVLDGRPMGFPLDRPADALDFTPFNMIFKDVVIYHKEMEDLNVVA